MNNSEYQKLNHNAVMRASVFIQLIHFPTHYLVIVITDEEFRYALIETTMITDATYASVTMDDIGWLDVRRLCGSGDITVTISDVNHPGVSSTVSAGRQGRERIRSGCDGRTTFAILPY